MNQELEFKMSDGLIIRGSLEGNIHSDNLVVMLHSGGYDRHEQGVKTVAKDEVTGKKKITYYNMLGNYDYLSNLLKYDHCILRIDQRNHGQSGKNIDKEKLEKLLVKLNLSKEDIQTIINAELSRDKATLKTFINKYSYIEDIVNRPPIKDMSFIQMKNDLKEVMYLLSQKTVTNFSHIDYVGTCMGTVVLGLYLAESPEKASSLTLFSPLYTFNYSFKNPPKEAELLTNKKNIVESGKQFRLGNAVEGPSTKIEIETISKDFIQNIANLNMPIFCIQGTSDALVSKDEQNKIFLELEKYRKANNLPETYYAEIDGIHCLYDSIFPASLEVCDFISSQTLDNEKKPLKYVKEKRKNML